MTTLARDNWIGVGIGATTFCVMVYVDSIVIAYMLYVVGGIALMFVPLGRKRTRSRWANNLLTASAVLLVLKGGVQLLTYYQLWTLSPAIQSGLPHTLDAIGGVVLGFLLALIVSGELVGRKS